MFSASNLKLVKRRVVGCIPLHNYYDITKTSNTQQIYSTD